MATVSISKRPDRDGRPGGWLARWREPDGTQRKRSFPRKIDAERFAADLGHDLHRGTYVPPDAGRVTVGEWAEQWFATRAALKVSTRARYRGLLDRHVLPRWGRVQLADVRHADVAAWVADLTAAGLAPGTVRQAHRVCALVLELAVRDGRLPRNPAAGVPLPRARRAEPRFLTGDEVGALADAGGGVAVVVLGYCGLRFGELAALRVADIDLVRRRIRVHRSATEVAGRLVESDTKTHAARSVPVPRFVADALAGHLAGRDSADYAFPAPGGGPLRIGNWRRRVFDPACRAAGIEGATPHDLRHTAASLAISAGASVKAVQRMLGHASAAVTLDVYSGLFDSDLDAVADRLDTLAPQVRPGAAVIPFREAESGL